MANPVPFLLASFPFKMPCTFYNSTCLTTLLHYSSKSFYLMLAAHFRGNNGREKKTITRTRGEFLTLFTFCASRKFRFFFLIISDPHLLLLTPFFSLFFFVFLVYLHVYLRDKYTVRMCVFY